MVEPATTAADTALDNIIDAALDHMAAGNPSAAIPHLSHALTLAPNHPAATHALLRALEDTNQIPEALALVHNLIAHSPDDVLAHTRLSILLQKSGDIPAAEAASARARILDWKRQLNSSIQFPED
jgi:Tfp pilus assembly protein PilF